MSASHKIKKALEIWRRGGWKKLKPYLLNKLHLLKEKRNFQKWILRKDSLNNESREKIRRIISDFHHKPLISIILPVYNVREKWLRLCLESVLKQLYTNWELCVADDCSPSPHVKNVLDEYAAKDERIKVVYRRENGHISAASNSALELATGKFAALLDHDDELSEDALFWVAKEINDFPETEMIYSDEDLIDEKGRRYQPKFKPDWSRDFFYSLNLITHLSVYKTAVLRKIGGFRLGTEGSQDYDLAMRVVEQIPEKHIRHIPKILYHWRAIRGSVAFSPDEKPYALERAREALRSHFERTEKKVRIRQTVHNLHHVRYVVHENWQPKASLIFSVDEDFEAAETSLKTFVEQTDYGNLELALICSPTAEAKLKVENLSSKVKKVKIIVCEKQTEAERFNFAVSQTDAEILCFADLNLKPLSRDWLAELAALAYQKEIGAAGAKLLYKDETVLHGGLIIGIDGAVGIAHHRFPREADGNFLRAQLVNNFSAVSVSCLATRREVFQSVGGFDAANLPNKFFDADFCLKLREKDYRVVFTPIAELIQINEKKRLNVQKNPTAGEKNYFAQKWRKFIGRDPFYNPNLSSKAGDFSIDI